MVERGSREGLHACTRVGSGPSGEEYKTFNCSTPEPGANVCMATVTFI